MLTFFWTVCSLEKVTILPAGSVSTSVPSLTCTLTLSVICMVIPSHVVVSMLPERCGYVHVIYAQSQEPSTVEKGQTSTAGFMSITVDMVESEGMWKGTEELVQEFNVRCTKVNSLN